MLVESIFHDAVRTAGGLFAGLALFRLIEVVLPAEDSPPPERNWLGVRIWGIYLAVQILLTAVILSLMDASGHRRPGGHTDQGFPILLGASDSASVVVALARPPSCDPQFERH